MPSVADLDLTSELERLRATIPAGSRQVLHAAQGFGLREVKAARDAADVLIAHAVRVLRGVPADQLSEDHPALAALSAVLAHPEASPRYFDILSPEQRAKVEELLPKRPMTWSADQLEWQWVQFVGTFTDEMIDPNRPLPGQLFRSRALETAWGALMDLEVLRAWGLVS
ncbi:MAG TPA: hypothetical protein VIG99_18645 [Myxococcaceae bacterium]|jgi:hypothetical protein